MKESNYNFRITINKNGKKHVILYNGLYGSAALIPKNSKFKNIKNKNSEITKLLQENKYLIEDDVNEIDLIKSQNKLQRFNERTLELTILPTMWCNLNCQYCYETRKEESMSKDDISTIYCYIKNKIIQQKIKTLSILWFGGEPLLEIEKIKNLSKKILPLIKKNEIQFKNSIITNGTLLTKPISKALLACGIKYVQITLDGPPEIHDKRKPLIGGVGSFKIIFNNLLNAVNYFDVSIRINVDKENIPYIKKLIDILTSFYLQNKLYVYLAKTENIQGACESTGGMCLNDFDFLNTEKKIFEYMNKKGFKKIAIPSYRTNYCTADNVHSFTILPNRKVHKCWHLVSDEKEIVGELTDTKINFNHNIYKWLAYDPLDNKSCINCKYLPLCMGGCPKIRLTQNITRCDILKNSIKRYIEHLLI